VARTNKWVRSSSGRSTRATRTPITERVTSVAMVTAAAHRCGKQLVHDLAEAGYDLAICSLAVLSSRVKTAEALGRRACALRLFTTAPASADAVVADVHRRLGPIDALIHIDGDALLANDGALDATSSAVLPDLVARNGTLLFICEQPRPALPQIGNIRVAGNV